VADRSSGARRMAGQSGRPGGPQAQGRRRKLATGLRERLLDHLAQRGILRKERDRILGLFPTTRWPAHDSTHEAELRAHLRRVLVDGVQPEPRLAALIALLHAVDAVPRVVGAADRKLAKQRAKAIAEGNWAS